MEQLLQLNIKKANYVNYKSQRGRGRGQDRGCGRGHKGEGRWGYNNYSNKFNSGQRSWNPQATRDRGIGNSWLRCDKSQIKCFKCNKIGHYASECKYSKNLVEKANFVEEKGGEEETLMLACQNQVEEKRNKLYLDIDVSNHMCGDQSMFIEINEVTTKNVSLEMTQRYRLKEKGKILIRLKNKSHQFISNVYYVPSMKNNILSSGQLLEKGYDIHLKEHSIFLRDCGDNLIAKVHMSKNRMFLLTFKMVLQSVPRLAIRTLHGYGIYDSEISTSTV
ncbi:uncharacterized protein LOC127078664 [Lathyrus oleraceus]|uniref:uncharacterized protein LOC127078664 n=1 Tax=Pisum sativum TaxID=3888 RepID=UPI0021D33552|nr:uncharacterized protein LOC127078664 [Pisum sativum]